VACALFAGCGTTPTAAKEFAKFTVDKNAYSIPESLTGKPGDPEKGREVAINRKKGNCLACHTLPIPEQPFHGRIGPPLTGIGARYSPEQLRLRVVNPKVVNPNTIMPSFYKTDGYNRPIKKFADGTILSAQEVEDIVAYLTTLK
jgi:sulfur-oxidizing protein SoxX